MKIYCVSYGAHAGKWIYEGYRLAWNDQGYEVCDLADLNSASEEHYIMTTDSWVNHSNVDLLKKAKKVFLYVQPNKFPSPWGSHPNFICHASDDIIKKINNLDNVILWSFADITQEYYFKWGHKINTMPLAYDSISYGDFQTNTDNKYDVCYIGGWANNGFDEKRKIMLDVFSGFKDSGLKCGFFINKNITHLQELSVISNSKVCLNIHDAYQRTLGLDTNERTFKTLGLNGILVSDKVNQITSLFPDVKTSNNTEEIVENVLYNVNLTEQQRQEIRHINKKQIAENHTYISRVKEFLKL